MRVDLTSIGFEASEAGKARSAEQKSESSAANRGAGSVGGCDQANLSEHQTQVESLQARVLAEPEIRQAKVEALRQAIDKGEYSVGPSQIADAIVGEYKGAQAK